MGRGFMIAAPQSGSGKTTITAGILRALARKGIALRPAKAGPDYIDPAFHGRASGAGCLNLDPWAMRSELINSIADPEAGDACLVVEAMMGLFDGAADGTGSAADLAALLHLPVILVIDAARQSQSIAALACGFRDFRDDISVQGVILNRVGSARHEAMLKAALADADIRVLGAVRRDADLALPSRHLGLVQAAEIAELERFIDCAADRVEEQIDLSELLSLQSTRPDVAEQHQWLSPPGQRIAMACDEAFAFIYPHLLKGWNAKGASVHPFSPLANEAPIGDCDAVFLPGGYPELHGGRLAAADVFLAGMRAAAARGAFVYGECGGYMVLGENLIDGDGACHKMAGLLRLTTSFEKPRLHLGYRLLTPLASLPIADRETVLAGHEFHYSEAVTEEGTPLFEAADACGSPLGRAGLRSETVCGSYMHLIDRR